MQGQIFIVPLKKQRTDSETSTNCGSYILKEVVHMDPGRKPYMEQDIKPNIQPDMNFIIQQLISLLAEQEGAIIEDYKLERIIQRGDERKERR